MTSFLRKEDYQLNKVILYPSGSVTAREHYSNTIETPVDIDKIVQFIPQNNIINFMDLYTTGAVPIWGVTPGKKNVNKNKWDRITNGDICLFAMDQRVVSSGTVVHKIHCRDLAVHLWGMNSSFETWEYILFLDNIKPRNISYKDIARAAGYSITYTIQKFDVLDGYKSRQIIEKLIDDFDQSEFNKTIESEVIGDISVQIPAGIEKIIQGIEIVRRDSIHIKRAYEDLVLSFLEYLGYKKYEDIKFQDGRFDIHLDTNSKPALTVLVKKNWFLIDVVLQKALKESFDYAQESGSRFVAITNADHYILYDRAKGMTYEEQKWREFKLNMLDQEDLRFIANKLKRGPLMYRYFRKGVISFKQ
jgi:hypothetical protein|tara:strand:- start:4047 stop:5129 length:1083 start_codon:yes stop_codon:yes gene_type:complete